MRPPSLSPRSFSRRPFSRRSPSRLPPVQGKTLANRRGGRGSARAGAVAFLLRDRLDLATSAPTAPVADAARSASLFILPFRNASGDAQLNWLGPNVANMLRTEVGQSASLRTVSGDRVTQILTDMRIAADASLRAGHHDPCGAVRQRRHGALGSVREVRQRNPHRRDACRTLTTSAPLR